VNTGDKQFVQFQINHSSAVADSLLVYLSFITLMQLLPKFTSFYWWSFVESKVYYLKPWLSHFQAAVTPFLLCMHSH